MERLDLPIHLKVHGPLEPIAGERLAALAEEISLRGRGGAGFPFARKLRAVAEAAIRRGVRPVVVVNGSEGEPACRKDTVLLNRAPHLILDGALLARGGAGRAHPGGGGDPQFDGDLRAGRARRARLVRPAGAAAARACGAYAGAHGVR